MGGESPIAVHPQSSKMVGRAARSRVSVLLPSGNCSYLVRPSSGSSRRQLAKKGPLSSSTLVTSPSATRTSGTLVTRAGGPRGRELSATLNYTCETKTCFKMVVAVGRAKQNKCHREDVLASLPRVDSTRCSVPLRRSPETCKSFLEASSQSTTTILPGSSTGAASPPARSTAAVLLYLAACGRCSLLLIPRFVRYLSPECKISAWRAMVHGRQ